MGPLRSPARARSTSSITRQSARPSRKRPETISAALRAPGSTRLAVKSTSGEIHPGVFPVRRSQRRSRSCGRREVEVAIVLATDLFRGGVLAEEPLCLAVNAIRSGAVLSRTSSSCSRRAGSSWGVGRTPTQDPQGIFFIIDGEARHRRAETLPASTPTNALGITATSPTGTKSQILSRMPSPLTSPRGSSTRERISVRGTAVPP